MSQFNFDKDEDLVDGTINDLAVMIDIETLGTTAGSPVITIGATLFDPRSCDSSEELMRRSLLIRCDISDSINRSHGVNGDTIRFWFEQKDAAIKALVVGDPPPVAMKDACKKLFRYCKDRGSFVNKEFFEDLSSMPIASTFWAKDPDFDMVLLRYYYEELNEIMPWKFPQCRSVRTIQGLAWPDPNDRPEFIVPGGVLHDARWDAIVQAMRIQAAMLAIGQSRDSDVEFKAWKGVTK